MEEYLSQRCKIKAIATYAFKSVCEQGAKSLNIRKVRHAMQKSLEMMNPNVNVQKFNEELCNIDRCNSGQITLDDFIQAFQRSFQILEEADSS